MGHEGKIKEFVCAGEDDCGYGAATVGGQTGAVHWASRHCLMLSLTNVSDPDLDNRRARPLKATESTVTGIVKIPSESSKANDTSRG